MAQILFLILLISYGFWWSLKSKSKLLKIVHWFTSVMLLIAGITFPIHQLLGMGFSKLCDDVARIRTTVLLSTTSYMMSLIGIGCLYALRLILSFKNSKYALSTCTITAFLFCIFIQFVSAVITIYWTFKLWTDIDTLDHYIRDQHYLQIAASLFAVINIIYIIVLLCLFLRKIFQIAKTVKQETEYVTNHLIKPSIVCTLCLTMTVVAMLIIFIFNGLRGQLIPETEQVYMIHVTLISLDVFINALSVNLQFESDAGQKIFDRCCKCCKSYLLTMVINKIKGKQQQQQSNHIQLASNTNAVTLTNIHPSPTETTETEIKTNNTTETTANIHPLPKLNASITSLHGTISTTFQMV